ncbi:hypothetical protein HanIR_Chr13g0666931 [Helianthus annuus]|nr:hypothetical protein HanIR_Chr13g0666931 [Helianthus annuus]
MQNFRTFLFGTVWFVNFVYSLLYLFIYFIISALQILKVGYFLKIGISLYISYVF